MQKKLEGKRMINFISHFSMKKIVFLTIFFLFIVSVIIIRVYPMQYITQNVLDHALHAYAQKRKKIISITLYVVNLLCDGRISTKCVHILNGKVDLDNKFLCLNLSLISRFVTAAVAIVKTNSIWGSNNNPLLPKKWRAEMFVVEVEQYKMK